MTQVKMFSSILVMYMFGSCGCASLLNSDMQDTIITLAKTLKCLNGNEKLEKEVIGKYKLRLEIMILIFI